MIKKILYIVCIVLIAANSVMILLNGTGRVEYRFNTITSYVSRVLILILIILFIMAIVNVRKSRKKDELPPEPLTSSPPKERPIFKAPEPEPTPPSTQPPFSDRPKPTAPKRSVRSINDTIAPMRTVNHPASPKPPNQTPTSPSQQRHPKPKRRLIQ